MTQNFSDSHLPFRLLRQAGLGVDNHPSKGRLVKALSHISTGSEIFSQHPYAAALSPNELSRCHFCHKYFNKTLRCSVCRFARYCTISCQSSDWSSHKDECGCFNRLPKDKISNLSVLSIRLLLRFHSEKSSDTVDNVTTLQDGPTEVLFMHKREEEEEMKEYATDYAQSLINALKISSFTVESVKDILMRTLRNSFAIPDRFNDEIGRAVYPSASLFNHSCKPNAWAFFDESYQIRIVAIKDIQAGEEISISYTTGFDPPQTRRLELRRSFGFWCQCVVCKEEPSLSGSDFNELLNCKRCQEQAEMRQAASQALLVASKKLWLQKLQLQIKELGMPSPDSHDFKHLKSLLEEALYFARVVCDHQQIFEISCRLVLCYEMVELPDACPAFFLTRYQISSHWMREMEWQKAVEILSATIRGMEIARSRLLTEARLMMGFAQTPYDFVKHATLLNSLPDLTSIADDVLHSLQGKILDPKFGIMQQSSPKS